MKNWLRLIFGSLTARRKRVVERDLLAAYAIDLARHSLERCEDAACKAHAAQGHIQALSDRMHQQSHRLHVLEWQADRFAAKVTAGEHETPRIIVPLRSARPS